MSTIRSFVAAVGIAALGATLAPQAIAAQGPRTDADVAASPAKKPGVVFDHVMVDPLDPGAIVPCVRVLRKFYKKAEKHPELLLRIRVTYLSNGVTVQKLVDVPLREMEITDHHDQPADADWILVDTTVDVSDAPIDGAEGATGSVEVLRDHGVAAR